MAIKENTVLLVSKTLELVILLKIGEVHIQIKPKNCLQCVLLLRQAKHHSQGCYLTEKCK